VAQGAAQLLQAQGLQLLHAQGLELLPSAGLAQDWQTAGLQAVVVLLQLSQWLGLAAAVVEIEGGAGLRVVFGVWLKGGVVGQFELLLVFVDEEEVAVLFVGFASSEGTQR